MSRAQPASAGRSASCGIALGGGTNLRGGVTPGAAGAGVGAFRMVSRPCALPLRAVLFLLVFSILLPAFAAVTPALASPLSETQAELEAALAQLDRLQGELDEYAAAYGEAEARQAEIDDAIVTAEEDEQRSSQDLSVAREQLNRRVVNLYKSRQNGLATVLQVFFTHDDLVGALAQLDSLQKVANQDQDFFASIGRHLENVDALQEDLSLKRTEQTQRLADLDAAQEELEDRIGEVSADYDRLRKQVARLEEEARRAREAAANAASVSGGSAAAVRSFVFPVDGPHSFANTWGAPRSGGRSHQGTDIFAGRGTACVAVVSGEITQTYWNQGLGGTCVWLAGSNGVSYYYAHLDGIADGISPGVSVRAGQVVGYVGNSGNAEGGPCHLHFQAHPGGGSPVNPYPVLAASD